MKLKEKQLSSKKEYECFFMKLFDDEVELPNGETSRRIYIKHDGASAVLPITKDGKIILVKQYRYPVQTELLEVPAGKKDFINESGLECVERELEEETALRSDNIVKVQDFHSCVGYSSEMIELFIAYDCEKVVNPRQGDDDEFIEILEFTKEEIIKMIKNGEVTDSKTLALLLHYLYFSK